MLLTYLSTYVPTYRRTDLPYRISTYLRTHVLSGRPTCLSACGPAYRHADLPTCLPIGQLEYLSTYMHTRRPTYLPTYVPICRPVLCWWHTSGTEWDLLSGLTMLLSGLTILLSGATVVQQWRNSSATTLLVV